jgi:hypothetical protein
MLCKLILLSNSIIFKKFLIYIILGFLTQLVTININIVII